MMNKKQKIGVIAAGAVLVIGLAVYGGVSLNNKLNEVDKLNGEIAERSETPQPSVQPGESPQPSDGTASGGAGGEQPQPTDAGEAVQPSDGATGTPASTQPDSGVGTGNGGGEQPAVTQKPVATTPPGGGTKPGEGSGSTANDKEKKKLEIDVAYAAKMDQLRSSCLSASNSLASQIAAELKADEDATLDTIQSKYMSRVFAAEADCDAKFSSLLSSAQAEYKAAGIEDMAMPSWNAQYDAAKSTARSEALTVISNALS